MSDFFQFTDRENELFHSSVNYLLQEIESQVRQFYNEQPNSKLLPTRFIHTLIMNLAGNYITRNSPKYRPILLTIYQEGLKEFVDSYEKDESAE